MRIGPLHVTWMTSRLEQMIAATLTSIFGRQLVAKIARAEVKNYLAELAEQAERPFHNPSHFLAAVRVDLARIDAANWDPAAQGDGPEMTGRFLPSAPEAPSNLQVAPRHAAPVDGRLYCNATPAGSNWPVCSRAPHPPGTEHSSADFAWHDGGRPIPIPTDEAF